uniref:Putative secreted protein n=1 Tax=Ixodes scapularis TaxID=6945 RepID=A0A4D5RDD7_IXOSC
MHFETAPWSLLACASLSLSCKQAAVAAALDQSVRCHDTKRGYFVLVRRTSTARKCTGTQPSPSCWKRARALTSSARAPSESEIVRWSFSQSWSLPMSRTSRNLNNSSTSPLPTIRTRAF